LQAHHIEPVPSTGAGFEELGRFWWESPDASCIPIIWQIAPSYLMPLLYEGIAELQPYLLILGLLLVTMAVDYALDYGSRTGVRYFDR